MKYFVLFITLFLFAGYSIAGDSLKVNKVLPVPQSMSAETSAMIEVAFNLRIDPKSFTDTTFMVWGRWSGVHQGTIDFNSIGTIAYFFPEKEFFYGEMVTISLSKGIKDELGNNLSFGYAWTFWTMVNKGSLDLTKTETIQVRKNGEGPIQTYGTYAGDLDGDGWSDFIVPNEISNDVRVFMNDGTGSYNNFTIFPVSRGNRPSTNEGMDYNLDGLIDFAVGNSQANIVTVFIGDGAGSFSSIQNYSAAQGVRGLTVADVQGDGFVDIITANRDASSISILVNNGDGTFAAPVNINGNVNGETACVTADVNSDGIMDLFVAGIQSDDVALLLGDGNGGFVFSDKVSVGNNPWMITSGDINLDGIPDVAIANASGSSLSIVFANSDGTLSTAVNYPTGSFPIAIDLGDIDGDGDLEVVVSNYNSANYNIYENDGTGNYINRRDLNASSAGSCAVLHDRDNDGDMDMTGIDEVDDLLILFTNVNLVDVEDEKFAPENFVLNQNYPNPFNPSTKIEFQIVDFGFITLKVYDVLGNEIATLVNEEKSAGIYEVEFDARATHPIALTSGIYFYQLKVGESFIDVKKMILMK